MSGQFIFPFHWHLWHLRKPDNSLKISQREFTRQMNSEYNKPSRNILAVYQAVYKSMLWSSIRKFYKLSWPKDLFLNLTFPKSIFTSTCNIIRCILNTGYSSQTISYFPVIFSCLMTCISCSCYWGISFYWHRDKPATKI